MDREVIVINDDSPDHTDQVCKAYQDRIVYIKQENRGLSGARNTGIRRAQGELIAFLDSDDIYLPGTLRRQKDYLDAHRDTSLVCGEAEIIDDKGEALGLRYGKNGSPRNPENFRWETLDFVPVPSTVMVRKVCFSEVGFFDEALKNAAEDWLMWMQMGLRFNMAYIDEPLVRYRLHSANATRNIERIHKGNRYAMRKLVDGPEFQDYPAHFRSRALYYRAATAWRGDSMLAASGYMIRAFLAHPGQTTFGWKVLKRGIVRTLGRISGRSRP